MRLELLLAVALVVAGCAQTRPQAASNGCEIVQYPMSGGGIGLTSGVDMPPGKYAGFVEMTVAEDAEFKRQRENGVSPQFQTCATNVLVSKLPADMMRQLDEAARGERVMCGREYSGFMESIMTRWRGDAYKNAVTSTCGQA